MSTTATRWPDRTELARIMHAPDQFITHSSLDGLSIKRRMGRVLSWNGQRTIVFRGNAGGREIAVRCPLAADDVAAARYVALGRHLGSVQLDSFVEARWIEQGIQLEPGHSIPIMTMDWVDGDTIEDHVTNLVDDRESERLRSLADKWWTCCAELCRSNVAHGDIHAGNVMVRTSSDSDQLVLIDYDGIWVPDLEHPSMEIGLPAFQHPRRTAEHWGRSMDAFANLVMYVSLRAVAHEPSLWMTHHRNDDTMLFDTEDFRDAPQAPVWNDLRKTTDPQIHHLTALLLRWLREEPNAYASLELAAANRAGASLPPPMSGKQTWASSEAPAAGSQGGTSRQSWASPERPVGETGAATSMPPPRPQTTASSKKQTWPPADGTSHPPPPAPTTPPTEPDWGKWILYLAIAIAVITILANR